MANVALFDVAIQRCLAKFQIDNLKREQRECIKNILANVDVLAVLPTGYGKSLIYQILPSMYKEMEMLTHGEVDGTSANSKRYCIIVVSPLEYIRKQQVLKLNSLHCGINAISIGDSKEMDALIESSFYNIVYGSAEQWLLPKWKSCLQFGSLHEAKVLVVDEVHTVETWGIGKKGQAAFREAFGKISELRSLLKDGTPVLGLTATANPEMRMRLMKHLCMKSGTVQIVVSPNRDNIRFTVLQADKDLHCFEWIISMLKEKKKETPYTMVFCKTVNDIVLVLNYFLTKLGHSVYVDGNEPAHERSLLGVYYSQTPKNAKDKITSSFECIKGNVRVTIASTSLSMGVDFPHVRYVIHYGPSKTLSSHLQEAGRAGRDHQASYHITVFQGRHLISCEKDVKKAVRKALNSCARVAYLEEYDKEISPLLPMHECCSFCHKECKCYGISCPVEYPEFDSLPTTAVKTAMESRQTGEKDKIVLKNALDETKDFLSEQCKWRMFDASGVLSHGLSTEVIDSIVSNIDIIFTVYDLFEHCSVPSTKVALIVLELFKELFDDIVIPDELYDIVARKQPLVSCIPLDDTLDQVEVEEIDDLPSYLL